VSHALDLQSDRSFFDYFGLNHLGWIREVYSDGEPQLRRLWNDRERLQSLYKVPLFDPAYLRHLELLPTEYVYYYESPTQAVDNMRRAGQTRGQAIAELTDVLFDALRNSNADSVAIYKSYLFSRSASYMQIESGAAPSAARVVAASQSSGYDKIALSVVRAIHRNLDAIIPLSVENRATSEPDGSRRDRSAMHRERQWRPAASRRRVRPGAAAARSCEGVRTADRPRCAGAVG
jgi:6-phospho-beta-glucosidase